MKLICSTFFIHSFLCFGLQGVENSMINHGFKTGELQLRFGTATAETVGRELRITASDGAVIDHLKGFDLGQNEIVNFIQPDSRSRVINQIFSDGPSLIDGKITANGKVFLINREGFIFGQSSSLHAASFSAIAGEMIYDADDFPELSIYDSAEFELLGHYRLTGKIESFGIIEAEEVILAGDKITNSGTISASDGALTTVAAGIASLYQNLSTNSLEETLVSSHGTVSDTLGIALLQSGILSAPKTDIRSEKILLEGDINSGELFFSSPNSEGMSYVNQHADSKITTTALSLDNIDSVNLASYQNEISSVEVESVSKVAVYSREDMTVAKMQSSPNEEDNNLYAQEVDFRVSSGDLTISHIIKPLDSLQENSLLLAAEGDLTFSNDYEDFTFSRKIAYARNLLKKDSSNEILDIGAPVRLYAGDLFVEDLDPKFDSSMVIPLVTANPDFQGFDHHANQIDFLNLNSNQLDVLLKYGLFVNYSYFLEAPSMESVLVKELGGMSEGSSFLFGGDYAVLTDGSDTAREDTESTPMENMGNIEVIASIRGNLSSVEPFSSISLPISSSEAGKILSEALTSEIEGNMLQFLLP